LFVEQKETNGKEEQSKKVWFIKWQSGALAPRCHLIDLAASCTSMLHYALCRVNHLVATKFSSQEVIANGPRFFSSKTRGFGLFTGGVKNTQGKKYDE